MSTYNIWNAAAYEITNILIDFNVTLEVHPLIKAIRQHCFPDWVDWKTERTLHRIDKQIDTMMEKWKKEDHQKYVEPIIIEHAPDNSQAQQLLGGMLEIKAPWYNREAPAEPTAASTKE